jgi:hypothetical protein
MEATNDREAIVNRTGEIETGVVILRYQPHPLILFVLASEDG